MIVKCLGDVKKPVLPVKRTKQPLQFGEISQQEMAALFCYDIFPLIVSAGKDRDGYVWE